MTSFRKYFGYHFRSTLLRGIILSVFAVLAALIFASAYQSDLQKEYSSPTYYYYVDIYIGNVAVVASILATVIPLLEMAPFKNRRNLDTLFFLPVSRGKMAAVHYLNGLLQVLGITALYFGVEFLRIFSFFKYMNMEYVPLYLGAILLAAAVMYSIFMFILTQANTLIDGVVFMTVYMVLGPVILEALDVLTGQELDHLGRSIGCYFIYSPVAILADTFDDLITPLLRYTSSDRLNFIMKSLDAKKLEFYAYELASFVFWLVIGGICVLGYFAAFIRQRSEKAGGISNSVFGYKTLIPLFSLSFLITGWLDGVSAILVVIAMAVGYMIYRRTFRLKLADWVILGLFLTVVMGVLIF